MRISDWSSDVCSSDLHIHIAEQVGEVQDCLALRNARPVEWLLDHAEIDARWCLVHATHMNEGEVRRVAASGAVVGLCPTTSSEERRVGNEGVSTCHSRWTASH